MKTLSSELLAALQAPVVPLVQLVQLQFAAGTVALNTSNWDLTFEGDTYRGAYGLGTISPIEDAPGEIRGLQFELSGASAAAIALALDGSDEWQGTPVRILTALLDPSTYQILDVGQEWTGLGDTMNIQEDGETAIVQATAESTAVDLLRGVPLTYSDADQKALYPADRAFELVVSQTGQPVVWPAKEWFRR